MLTKANLEKKSVNDQFNEPLFFWSTEVVSKWDRAARPQMTLRAYNR